LKIQIAEAPTPGNLALVALNGLRASIGLGLGVSLELLSALGSARCGVQEVAPAKMALQEKA
jgi:hypothetical protein